MGWHPMEPQRYKLWHPRAHVDNATAQMLGDDPTLTDKQKYMTTHYVTGYIGDRREDVEISFVEPEVLLTRTPDFSVNGVSALACARVRLQRAPILIAHLIHQIREVDGGSEMRSRFWLGKPQFKSGKAHSIGNRVLGAKPVRALLSPAKLAHSMLVHCAMEMNHLASFLPDLYADYQ